MGSPEVSNRLDFDSGLRNTCGASGSTSRHCKLSGAGLLDHQKKVDFNSIPIETLSDYSGCALNQTEQPPTTTFSLRPPFLPRCDLLGGVGGRARFIHPMHPTSTLSS